MTADTAQLHAVRERWVADLRSAQQETGCIPTALLREAARDCKADARSVRRWVDRDTTPRPAGFAFEDEHLTLLAVYGGNVKAAWRRAQGEGLCGGKSYRTWANAWKAIPQHVRIGITQGPQAAKKSQFYAQRPDGDVGDRWELDGWRPNVHVLPPTLSDEEVAALIAGGEQVPDYVKPWVVAVVDARSRLVVAHGVLWPRKKNAGVTAEFGAAVVAKALRARSVRPRLVDAVGDFSSYHEDDLVVGGVPSRLVTDNENALCGQLMQQLAQVAGFELETVPRYTGEAKGRIERLNRTLDGLVFDLPGQTHGPETYTGKYAFAQPEQLLRPEEFEAALEQRIEAYNFRTSHSAIGCTPFEEWMRRGRTLPEVDEAHLAPFRMRHPHKNGQRVLQHHGVMVGSRWFGPDDISAFSTEPGAEVIVRLEPGNRSWVDLWRVQDNGAEHHIGRAIAADTMTIEERQLYPEVRGLQRQKNRDIVDRAARFRRESAAGLDEAGDHAEVIEHLKKLVELDPDLVAQVLRQHSENVEGSDAVVGGSSSQGAQPEEGSTATRQPRRRRRRTKQRVQSAPPVVTDAEAAIRQMAEEL